MRPHTFRPQTWPLSVKVPLQAALFTFLVAVVTTQAALILSSAREEWLVEKSLGVLAAGVAVAVGPAVSSGPEAAAEALRNVAPALAGSLAESIGLAFTDGAGERHVLGTRAGAGAAKDEFLVTRAFGEEARFTITIVADADAVEAVRRKDQVRIAVVQLFLAFAGAGVALWFARATLAPVEALTADLVGDGAMTTSPGRLAPVSTEFGRLQRVMNERIAAEEERAGALVRLADQERTAGLARLAASMAHEVRNPLAGLMNAVSTLRRFGDDPAVRSESLDLIERGLRSIERVAGAALATYRPATDGAGFGARDLADLEVLVAPEARRRGVSLAFEVAIEDAVPVDGALLRQVTLNILLNAVKASGSGGTTTLAAHVAGDELLVMVTDTGPGLPSDVRRFLAGGHPDIFPRPGALGLWTVMRLLDDIGGHLSIDTHPGRGTTVTIHAPVSQAAEAADGTRRSA